LDCTKYWENIYDAGQEWLCPTNWQKGITLYPFFAPT
jgi:hypothetical protein